MKIYQKQKEENLSDISVFSDKTSEYVQDDMESTELLYARKKGRWEPISSASYGGE